MDQERAKGRVMALTGAHLARVAREVERRPARGDLTPLTDADYEALASRLLARLGDAPFWVFAYGSLIWKPGFDHVAARRATVHGWRRSFCLHLDDWRGTPETPGLMLALERGGACTGVAYLMPPDDRFGRMVRLLRREMAHAEAEPWLRWVTARAEGTSFRALAFYCAPPGDGDYVRLPLAEQARRLATAAGHVGSCAEYLHNTVAHLEALGIRDRYLWRLQALVAAGIEQLDPPG